MINKTIKIIIYLFPFVLFGLVLMLRNGLISYIRVAQPFEIIADMDHQKKLYPQRGSDFFPDSASVRTPPENSVATNVVNYPFSQIEFDSAETKYTNPLPENDFVMQRGKNRFEVFCIPCHGRDGKGRGLIVTKPIMKSGEEGFPSPADLTSDRTRGLSDARLFHILSAGQNLMFPVNFKLNPADRWAVIKYIRGIQH
jgi:mono/diheme cytochrome c family protein